MCNFFIFKCLTANQAALLHTCITLPNNDICGAYYVQIFATSQVINMKSTETLLHKTCLWSKLHTCID